MAIGLSRFEKTKPKPSWHIYKEKILYLFVSFKKDDQFKRSIAFTESARYHMFLIDLYLRRCFEVRACCNVCLLVDLIK